MNVLSLFDGMSCGQLALERACISYNQYFASEIDKYAIKVTQTNYPNTIQLGDVHNVHGIDLPKIDLLFGGSPCQGFSVAGKLGGFNDDRSALFWEYDRILKEVKPQWFLLENVRMREKDQDIISRALDCEPIMIDSALVSAQSRKRLYWTNIPNVTLPADKHILLQNIIENGIVDRDKSYCIDACYYKGGNPQSYVVNGRRQLIFKHQSQRRSMLMQVNSSKEQSYRKLTPLECERLQTVPDNYTACVSNTQRYKMLGNGWTIDVIVHILKGIT
jgi:site-specific DNA-cytosine methylase